MFASTAQEIRKLSWTEEYLRILYGQHMREMPRMRIRSRKGTRFSYDRQRPWVFIGSKHEMKAASTFATLLSMIWDQELDTTYYTPNSFYRNDIRSKWTARWIHALAIDIDQKPYQHISVQDILDRCDEVGLPLPTIIVSTPSGGYHVTWAFDHSKASVRATFKTIALFEAVQKSVALVMNADLQAVGVERIFRLPTEKNIRYFRPVAYPFQTFIDWRNEYAPGDEQTYSIQPVFDYYNIMNEPAIRTLYNQDAVIGTREATCFTLALAMKFSGYSLQRALEEIETWWHECCEKGGKEPFSLRDAQYKVTYVYSRSHLHGPSAEVVRRLTGVDFHYNYARIYTGAKPRHERKRSHFAEWKADLLDLIQQEGGSICASQKGIAERLGCAVSTLKYVISELEREGMIRTEKKQGRNGFTRLELAESILSIDMDSTPQLFAKEKNSQSQNTMGEGVGGAAVVKFPLPGSPEDLIASLAILNAPFPSTLPSMLRSLYEEHVSIWNDLPSYSLQYCQDAAVYTYAVIKKTLMDCLRAAKREKIKSLTEYIRIAIIEELKNLQSRGLLFPNREDY